MTSVTKGSSAKASSVRADPGVISVIVAVDSDPARVARTIKAVGALVVDGFSMELVVSGPTAIVSALRDLAPDAVVVDAGRDVAVAACRNAGARRARGEYLAFLAPGTEPEPNWLTAAFGALRDSANHAMVSSWILAGDTIRFAGAGMAVTGDPLSIDAGRRLGEVSTEPSENLFPSDSAFVVDARAFAFVDGIDEGLGSRVATADLGWRLRLAGLSTVSVPQSRVQVGDEGADASSPEADANGLLMLLRNLGDDTMSLLMVATLLTNRRPGGARALAGFDAGMEAALVARQRVQSQRVVPDPEVLSLFRTADAVPGLARADTRALLDQFDAGRPFEMRRRIAVVTPDVLRPKMAGPAIRAWRMAIALSRQHDVRLASTVACDLEHGDFDVSYVDDDGLRALESWCDVLIFQGHVMHNHPWLERSQKVLVVDVYDPIHLEVLEQSRDRSDWDRRHIARTTVEVLNTQLARGDHFLCASEKQRDFWLGQLAGLGRLNPATYDDEENLEQLISVVPFGLDDEPPHRTGPAIRGVVPGIGHDDKVVIWGGGVYNWFDPLTLIEAIDRLRVRVPEVRLYFMGLKHPNPNVPAMRMAYDTRTRAEELGLVDTHVFFNEGWVDYDERQNYLLEADVGVSTHLHHIETALSFRTRILDYLWASLPVVATAGDSFAELIEWRGLGVVVPPGDVEALEEALHRVLTDDAFAQQCRVATAEASEAFRWSTVLEPVLEICANPRRAPDLVDPRQRVMIGDPILQSMWGKRGIGHSLRVMAGHLRRREYDDVIRKARMRLRVVMFPESAGPAAQSD